LTKRYNRYTIILPTKENITRKEKNMAITLKAARVNVGLTQKQAAEKLGISDNALWNYENGRSFPNVKVIKEMETVYGVSYNDLIFLPTNNGKTVIDNKQ
jgi:transcriptional regulator with XRE-family HTH domain